MNIFALSTGKGPSGIAILRLSGKDSLQISKLITKKNDIKSKEVNLCKFYDPSNGKISNVSPIGKALLGRRVGDQAEINVPSGYISLKIVKIS